MKIKTNNSLWDGKYIERLRCADCKSGRVVFYDDEIPERNYLICLDCGREYSIENSVPIMLPRAISDLEQHVSEEVQAKLNEIDYYSNCEDLRPEESQNLVYGRGWSLMPPVKGDEVFNWYLNKTGRHISDMVRGKDLLKVGCGMGRNSEYFAREYGCRVTGMDIAGDVVRAAVKRSICWGYSDRFTGVCGDMENLPFNDKAFDFSFTEASLHHSLDPHKAISELLRVSRKGIVIYNEPVYSISIKIALLLGVTEEYETEESGNKVQRFKEKDLKRTLFDLGVRKVKFRRNWLNTSNKIRWGCIKGKRIRPITKFLESEFALNIQDGLLGPIGNSLMVIATY